LFVGLAGAAVEGHLVDRQRGAAWLSGCDGRTWLALDEAARWGAYGAVAPVVRADGWSEPELGEPTGLVAVIASLHANGWIRQQATRVLANHGGRVGGLARLRAAALAVRALDHVRQVRQEALRGLSGPLVAEEVEPALGVLLAGRGRRHAAAALDVVRESALAGLPVAELVESLAGSQQLAVRRWAVELAHEHGLFSVQRLLAIVESEPDQLLRARCASWLAGMAGPSVLRTLLAARVVEARLVALTQVPEDDLPTESLLPMLADPAARVREIAQWRVRRRGLDAADWYRRQLAASRGQTTAQVPAPKRIAACLAGLAAVGQATDAALFVDNLTHASPRVRAVAAQGVGAVADSSQVSALITPLLLDTSPRVSSTAAHVLAHRAAIPADVETAWASGQPWSRRAAWRVSRASGSWDRVEADLRAATDDDPDLSGEGQSGLRNWLDCGAATTWATLQAPQRERLRDLLASPHINPEHRRLIAFHAGIPRGTQSTGTPDLQPGQTSPRRPAMRLFHRKRAP